MRCPLESDVVHEHLHRVLSERSGGGTLDRTSGVAAVQLDPSGERFENELALERRRSVARRDHFAPGSHRSRAVPVGAVLFEEGLPVAQGHGAAALLNAEADEVDLGGIDAAECGRLLNRQVPRRR